MNTSTTSAAVVLDVDRTPSRSRRAVNRVVMLGVIIGGYLGLTATGAFAQTVAPADSTGGLFTSLQSSLTTVIIPAAAALIVVALVFAMAVKWVGKASKKA